MEAVKTYFEQIKPTFIENWPSDLMRLSIASAGVQLSPEEATALGSKIMELGELFGPPQDISGIRSRVAALVSRFPGGAFIRLGSRSPKDSWAYHRFGGKTGPDEDPLLYLLDCSERVSDDLAQAIQENYWPWIWARQWVTIEPWAEFRCFQKDGELVGISQYNYHDTYPEIEQHKGSIEWVIRDQFYPSFRQAFPDNVVFDVWMKCRQHGNSFEWQAKLLEINPFMEMTDPCLFDWRQPFDGGFRIKPNPAQKPL